MNYTTPDIEVIAVKNDLAVGASTQASTPHKDIVDGEIED